MVVLTILYDMTSCSGRYVASITSPWRRCERTTMGWAEYGDHDKAAQ
jgi:hypothetical protein